MRDLENCEVLSDNTLGPWPFGLGRWALGLLVTLLQITTVYSGSEWNLAL